MPEGLAGGFLNGPGSRTEVEDGELNSVFNSFLLIACGGGRGGGGGTRPWFGWSCTVPGRAKKECRATHMDVLTGGHRWEGTPLTPNAWRLDDTMGGYSLLKRGGKKKGWNTHKVYIAKTRVRHSLKGHKKKIARKEGDLLQLKQRNGEDQILVPHVN